MIYRKFTYGIDVYPIIPPLPQGDKFGGKVIGLQAPGGKPTNFVAHEHWGKTEEEAFAKANVEAKEWVDKHLKG